jgi:DNA replication protein DnaC
MTNLDEILKQINENLPKGNSTISSNVDPAEPEDGTPLCPLCHGTGVLYYNVPENDPRFGDVYVCECSVHKFRSEKQESLLVLSNLQAYREKTFDNFNPKGRAGLREDQMQSLQFALNQAMLFARNLSNWLLLMGVYGCGKTHLAAAIANDAISCGTPTLFTTVPDLLDWLRFSYGRSEESFEDRFEKIRTIPLLVLDDLGTQNATDWAREKLFQILNYRYAEQLPTVLTTNQTLEDMDGRVRSRLEDRDLVNHVQIQAPDYRSPFTDTSNQVQLSSLHIHNNQRFETFSLRESEALTTEQKRNLKNLLTFAKKYAKSPGGWLVMLGDFGTGKTHLAAAIANQRNEVGDNPMFVLVPDLLDHLRATFNPDSNIRYDKLFEQIKNAKLLVLDDLGTQSATPWAKEKLYQILNYRYNAQLPTIITSAQALDAIDPRIRSRMLDGRLCDIFEISAPPFRVLPKKHR